jgi:hypothetical protein
MRRHIVRPLIVVTVAGRVLGRDRREIVLDVGPHLARRIFLDQQ